jgi:LAO/AO transport system kinase
MAGWSPPVLLTSAVEDRGIDDVWRAVLEHRAASLASGTFAERRAAQALQWMWSEVREEMQRELLADPGVAAEAEALTEAVRAGTTTPIAAARALLARRPR